MPAKPKPVKEKKRKRRFPKSERKQLESRLDLLVSTIVILRDGKCVTCGATGGLTCSHFVKRGKKLLRYDLQNCNCMCASCNLRHNNFPGTYTRYIEVHYGLDVLHKLQDGERVNSHEWSISELLALEESLLVDLERVLSVQTDPLRVEWAVKRLS